MKSVRCIENSSINSMEYEKLIHLYVFMGAWGRDGGGCQKVSEPPKWLVFFLCVDAINFVALCC